MSDETPNGHPAATTAPSQGTSGSADNSTEEYSPRGLRAVVFGTLIAVFAPLAGFLGGTMVGSTGSVAELDPLFVWLFFGFVVGGAGAIVAIMGGLAWVRADHTT